MIYSHEVQQMCCVKKGANHASAPILQKGKWVVAKEIKDISGLTHGIGWCATQQHQVVVQAVLCTPIIWAQVPLLTV